MPASPPRPSPAPATPSSAVATPRRRRRLLPSKPSHHHSPSPSPSLAPSSPFSFFQPASPSPFHRFLPSPLRASAVPFSWEHRPGIPKTPARAHRSSSSSSSKSKALPLPPSLLARSCAGGSDPYAASVVPAELAAAMDAPDRLGWRVRRGRRRSSPRLGDALAEWLSMLSLYRSCKRAAACFAAKANKSPAA
ncbi:unnamed protein product [Urochloa humidicola]